MVPYWVHSYWFSCRKKNKSQKNIIMWELTLLSLCAQILPVVSPGLWHAPKPVPTAYMRHYLSLFTSESLLRYVWKRTLVIVVCMSARFNDDKHLHAGTWKSFSTLLSLRSIVDSDVVVLSERLSGLSRKLNMNCQWSVAKLGQWQWA